jgi:hypothetical protein
VIKLKARVSYDKIVFNVYEVCVCQGTGFIILAENFTLSPFVYIWES